MSEQIRVRGYLEVTFTVEHDFAVDRSEFEDWRGEAISSEIDTDELLEFVRYQDDAMEITAEFPNVDPRVHEVSDSAIVEVELLPIDEPGGSGR